MGAKAYSGSFQAQPLTLCAPWAGTRIATHLTRMPHHHCAAVRRKPLARVRIVAACAYLSHRTGIPAPSPARASYRLRLFAARGTAGSSLRCLWRGVKNHHKAATVQATRRRRIQKFRAFGLLLRERPVQGQSRRASRLKHLASFLPLQNAARAAAAARRAFWHCRVARHLLLIEQTPLTSK